MRRSTYIEMGASAADSRIQGKQTRDTPTATVIKAEIIETWKHPVSGVVYITTDTDCAYVVTAGKESRFETARNW